MAIINPMMKRHEPFNANRLYKCTGIERSKLGQPTQDCIEETRLQAQDTLSLHLKLGTQYPFLDILSKGTIKVVSIEPTSFTQYVKVKSDSGKYFVCHPSDIHEGVLDSMDVFVTKKAIKSDFYEKNPQEILPFASVVKDIKESDIKMYVNNLEIHRALYNDYGYAKCVQVQEEYPLCTHYSLPDFNMCRIRDLYVGQGLSYTTRI